MEPREYSDCLKELFNKLDKPVNILDSSTLKAYDMKEKQWVLNGSIN